MGLGANNSNSYNFNTLEMSEEIISRDSIVAGTPDWQEGYDQGVLQTRNKVHELFNEVIEAYESMIIKGGSKNAIKENEIVRCQINAVKFSRGWVASGGLTDSKGNRTCYPW